MKQDTRILNMTIPLKNKGVSIIVKKGTRVVLREEVKKFFFGKCYKISLEGSEDILEPAIPEAGFIEVEK